MSTRARRVRGKERSRITAPSVPMMERRGAGMKKGQVASTPCLRARKKSPISCVSMMKSSASEKPRPWRSISTRFGAGSCVSLSTLPATNAEPKGSRKRRMLSKGGRSAPSVPCPGGGRGSSVSAAVCIGSIAKRSVLPAGAGGSCAIGQWRALPGLARVGRDARGRHGGRPLGGEFHDVAAVHPEPEEGFLRLAVLAEHGVARGPGEGAVHARERRPQLVARLRPAFLDGFLEQARRVVGMRLEEAGRAVV